MNRADEVCKLKGILDVRKMKEGAAMRGFGKLVAVMTVALTVALGLAACGDAASSKGPVYLKTRQVYYDLSSGSVQSELTWTYDSKGNKTKQTIATTGKDSNVTVEDTYGDFDPDGYPVSHSSSNGSETEDSTYEYTRENGRVVKAVDSSGGETSYSYHENGFVKTVESTSGSGITNLYEYDENGYLIKTSSSGNNANSSSTVMWTKDDNGAPSGMVYNSTKSGKSNIPVSYTVQCDDNGKITRIYAPFGKLYEEVEYTKIEAPSLAAWIEGHKTSA